MEVSPVTISAVSGRRGRAVQALLDWVIALGAQVRGLPYDAASPTRISDNFLVEVIALTFAYRLGAHAQRRRDVKQGKRGVASDIVRDLRELKDASYTLSLHDALPILHSFPTRRSSDPEERRVGKECRNRKSVV